MHGSIQHVYFFIQPASDSRDNERRDSATTCPSPALKGTAYHVPPFDNKEREATSKRIAANRDTSTSSSDNSGASSRSSSATLSATAAPFVPPPRMTSATDLFVVRAAPGKGLGIFASKTIVRGTRIICEAPLLRIPCNEPHLAWEAYEQLSPQARQEYDQLHRFRRAGLDLEQEARTRLPGSDDPKVLADQVAVMERFSANNFLILGGDSHAVFKLSSRLNHACEPNVFQCFNPCLGMKTVHAMRDIQAGEELVTNYLGRVCHYSTRTQRWEILRSQWGFTCQCAACTDRTGLSDARHSLLGNVIYGLEEFIAGNTESTNPFLPPSTPDALDQARDAVSLCLDQKMYGPELVLAHRLISTFALQLQDYQTAWEAALHAQEVERNIMGTGLDDLKAKGAGADVWMYQVWNAMSSAGFNPKQQGKPKRNGGKKRKVQSEQKKNHQQEQDKKANYHRKHDRKEGYRQKQEREKEGTNAPENAFATRQR